MTIKEFINVADKLAEQLREDLVKASLFKLADKATGIRIALKQAVETCPINEK